MPKLAYSKYSPTYRTASLILKSIDILEDYASQGFTLTLRQLYYQLVSKDIIPNSQKSYNSIGKIVSSARDAGMIDWDHIEDRTRSVKAYPHWSSEKHFMHSVAPQFKLDLWTGQETRVFVFVEKEALAQIVGKAASRWDVPYFANKGYLSSSSAWDVARNMMLLNNDDCKQFVVLHLGDHDPSGIDMTRDIQERLNNYARPTKSDKENGASHITIYVKRIALNMNQIEQYDPPPNPAKETDSRFEAYQQEFGDESWELDALEPSVLVDLISSNIEDVVNYDKWSAVRDKQESIKSNLLRLLE